MYSMSIDSDRVADKFGGGIPKRSLTYIEGENGTGKSVLSQRFAYGFCSNGVSVAYVTPQFDTKNFLSQTYNLSYDLIDYLITEKLLDFIPVHLDEKTDGDMSVIQTLMEYDRIWENDVIIIDSFDIILDSDPVYSRLSSSEQTSEVSTFVNFSSSFAKENNAAVIITSNPSNTSSVDPARNHSDIYMRLGKDSVAGDTLNTVDVVRFLLSENAVDDSIMFQVQSGNGISIDSRSFA